MKRVLVWGLSNNKAGTEKVIESYCKGVKNIGFDFLCYEKPYNYNSLFTDCKNRYYVIPIKIKHPIKYAIEIYKFMSAHRDEYDALWMNINEMSNIDLMILAKRFGITNRIVHMHSKEIPKVFITRVFSRLNWKKCLKLATHRWACSIGAGNFFYRNLPFEVVPNTVNAINVAFDDAKRNEARNELGISGSYVIGTVGRLEEVKNQKFLVKLMPLLLKVNPDTKLIIIGEGSERTRLEQLSKNLGISDDVLLLGEKKDIGKYLSSFDVFALPSLFEGLSLALLEAQFNCLPCVVSDGVDNESFFVSQIKQIPTKDEDGWIRALLLGSRRTNLIDYNKASQYDNSNVENLFSFLND